MGNVDWGVSRGDGWFADPRSLPWSRYATSDGTGVADGTVESATVDASVAPIDFWVEAQPGETLIVARLMVMIQDASFVATDYGAITLGATDGVSIILEQGGVEVEDLTGGVPIRDTAHWAGQCYDVTVYEGFPAGDEAMAARYTFAKHGAPLRLEPGDKLIIRLDGNFSTLTEHHFLLEGAYERVSY